MQLFKKSKNIAHGGKSMSLSFGKLNEKIIFYLYAYIID